MSHYKSLLLIGVALLVSLLLTQCAPETQPTSEGVVEFVQEAEQAVVEEAAVEQAGEEIPLEGEGVLCPEEPLVFTLDEGGSFSFPDMTSITEDAEFLNWLVIDEAFFSSPENIEVMQFPLPGTIYDAPQSISVEFQVSDTSAAYTASCTAIVEIQDRRPPQLSVSGVAFGAAYSTQDGCVTPVIEAQDNYDDLASLTIETSVNGTLYQEIPTICEPGVYTLKVKASDTAGNWIENPPIIFSVVDPEYTRAAAMVMADYNCNPGGSLQASVLLASDQFDVLEIDGYSVGLHLFDDEGQVLEIGPIEVAGIYDPEYIPEEAQASYQEGVWELNFAYDYPADLACPAYLLMTGSALDGELDWVAHPPLEGHPLLDVVSLAPLNVPLAPALVLPNPFQVLADSGLTQPNNPTTQNGFKKGGSGCGQCKWKWIYLTRKSENNIVNAPEVCDWFYTREKRANASSYYGYISGEGLATDQCFGQADAATSAIGEQSIKVWLEGIAKCCGCSIDVVANPSFKASTDLDPPGLAEAGGKIKITASSTTVKLEATAAGGVVSGSTKSSVTVGAITVPALSVTKGKRNSTFSDSQSQIFSSCRLLLTIQGSLAIKVKADADMTNPYAEASARIYEADLGTKIVASCTKPTPPCAPTPLTIELR